MTTNTAQHPKKRLDLIDTLRGLSIISMIIFHTVWIMNSFGYGISSETLYGPLCTFWERTICMGFILISGFSFSLGRRHVRNAALTFGLGAAITLVTCIFVPEIRIVFGVLTFLGSAGFIMIPIDKALSSRNYTDKTISSSLDSAPASDNSMKKTAWVIFSLLTCALFIFTYSLHKGWLGAFGHELLTLPEGLFKGYFMTYLGFTDPTFFSSDYFPIMPWIFWYFLGYFLEKLSRGTSLRSGALTKGIPALSFLGRHSLIIYVIHPVVIFAAVYVYSAFS